MVIIRVAEAAREVVDVIKKIFWVLVVAFIVYYLLKSPAGAADAVKGAGEAVIEAFGQIGRFFNRLVS